MTAATFPAEFPITLGEVAPPPPRPFTTTRPPPVESLGVAYFSPLLAVPVCTRQPQPGPGADTVTAYLRVQSGGGAQRPDGLLWDVSLLLHSYAPDDLEDEAEELLTDAVGWGANAQGSTITTRSGVPWYVTYSTASALGTRQSDPLVNLTRYRGQVTWRLRGHAVA